MGKKSFCWRNAYAPTGNHFATAGYDKTVTLYAASDGRLLHTLTGHTGWVEAIAFSPDGKQVASTGRDKTVRVWPCAAARNVTVSRRARRCCRRSCLRRTAGMSSRG